MNFLEKIEINPQVPIIKGNTYPFIEMANVSTCFRSPDRVEIKRFDSGIKFQDGDTVIARITPCLQNGKRFFCQNIGTGFGSTEFLVFRPKDDSVDNIYLYYFMQTEFIKQSMINSMTGATGRQRVNNDVFKDITVDFPDTRVQRKIGNILSDYDNLIENNQKQIKLLEEAAQRLYKEWFVDFHFPGYENTPIVDGLPEGWKLKELGNIFDFVRGKSYKSNELSETQGVLFLNLKSIRPFGGYNRNAEKRFTGKYNKNQSLCPGDIIMGVTDMTKERRLVGQVAIVPNLKEEMTFSMDLIKLEPKCVLNSYLYSTFFYGGFSHTLSPYANGVNVLHLKPESIMKLRMLVPTLKAMQAFDHFFTSINTKIELLEDQTNIAKSARDLLLPKLMSGEIEV